MTAPDRLVATLLDAFNRHDWAATAQVAEQVLMHTPQHPAVHYMAGVALLELGELPKALTHLHLASQLAPDRPDVLAAYARALVDGKLPRESLAVTERALALKPGDPRILRALALVLTRNEQHEKATATYRAALRGAPRDAQLHYHYALSLMFSGDLDRARAEIDTCLQLDPRLWKAYGTRTELSRATPESNHVPELEALLERHAADAAATEALSMALAREYEALGRAADSFAALARAKALTRARQQYDFAADRARFEALAAHPPAVAGGGEGNPTREPIFVIGMPRSGTTLVDRILSSHPQVTSAGELHQFGSALKRLSGSRTPAALDVDTVQRAQALDWARLGADYLETSRSLTGKTPRFVDKQPHNFLYLGYIANALPNAPIICLRRNPMDTCLSNFRQIFGEQSPFHGYALDLLDTGRYYLLFERLMAQWKQAYPDRILEVSYERLVDEQEAVTREILAFCGLEWHPDCLAFERNTAPVSTASTVQVRSPINRHSLHRWKRYEAELQPLRELLEANGITTIS